MGGVTFYSLFADVCIREGFDLLLSEAQRLRQRYPEIPVAPPLYQVENTQFYQLKELCGLSLVTRWQDRCHIFLSYLLRRIFFFSPRTEKFVGWRKDRLDFYLNLGSHVSCDQSDVWIWDH